MKTSYRRILLSLGVISLVFSNADISHSAGFFSDLKKTGTDIFEKIGKPQNNSPSTSTSQKQAINTEIIKSIQSNLTKLGYNPGPVDGAFGSNTRNAIKQFEKSRGLPVKGEPTKNLLASLERETNQSGNFFAKIAPALGVVAVKVLNKDFEGRSDCVITSNEVAVLGGLIVASLSKQDQQYLENSTKKTIATGKTVRWSNPDTGVSGETKVTKKETKKKSIDIPVIKERIHKIPPLDLIGEKFTVNKVAKLYDRPGAENKVFDEFPVGKIVSVIGKVQGSEWYMVSENGAGSGFVQTNTLIATGEAMLSVSVNTGNDIVTKSIIAELECREIEQVVTMSDQTQKSQTFEVCEGYPGCDEEAVL